MNAVGNVAYVEFVVEIARPYTAQNLLAYLTVQPAHSVDFLRHVACQNAHRELLRRIVRLRFAQVDELFPGDAQPVGVV